MCSLPYLAIKRYLPALPVTPRECVNALIKHSPTYPSTHLPTTRPHYHTQSHANMRQHKPSRATCGRSKKKKALYLFFERDYRFMPRETEVRMGAEAETGRRGSGAEKRGRAESRDTRNASCKSSLSYRLMSIFVIRLRRLSGISTAKLLLFFELCKKSLHICKIFRTFAAVLRLAKNRTTIYEEV